MGLAQIRPKTHQGIALSKVSVCVCWPNRILVNLDTDFKFMFIYCGNRSYYRCSSSKGCLARKQVEQSCTDPGMFIITYTAEHSHSQPTRRNSLAGTVRQKFPSPKQAEKSQLQQQTEMNMKPRVKVEEKAHSSDDFVFNEDFFSGLEEFDEFAQPFRSRPCSWA